MHTYTRTQRMRQGVQRDLERQQKKKENKTLLEEQILLHKQLTERDTSDLPKS